FFFQAEDGIRDFHVTGVQTCALPIFGDCYDFLLKDVKAELKAQDVLSFVLKYFADIWPERIKLDGKSLGDVWHYSGWEKSNSERSEERRVGKECRCRWARSAEREQKE